MAARGVGPFGGSSKLFFLQARPGLEGNGWMKERERELCQVRTETVPVLGHEPT